MRMVTGLVTVPLGRQLHCRPVRRGAAVQLPHQHRALAPIRYESRGFGRMGNPLILRSLHRNYLSWRGCILGLSEGHHRAQTRGERDEGP